MPSITIVGSVCRSLLRDFKRAETRDAGKIAVRWALSWRSIRALGQSRTVKSSYFWLVFVPIVARALAESPNSIRLPIGEQGFDLAIKLPFTWQVFYGAALAISAGTILFSMRCPRVIRDFSDLHDFRTKSNSGSALLRAIAKTDEPYYPRSRDSKDFRKFLSAYCGDNTAALDFLHEVERLHEAEEHGGFDEERYYEIRTEAIENGEIREEHIVNAFEEAQNASQYANPTSLLACQALLFLGFALFGGVILQNTLYVFNLLN